MTTRVLIDQAAMLLPRIKITELLMDMDDWMGFARHFVRLKGGEPVKDKTLLLSVILAGAINPGLAKTASTCGESSKTASSGRYTSPERLSVRFFPFSMAAPSKLFWLRGAHTESEPFNTVA